MSNEAIIAIIGIVNTAVLVLLGIVVKNVSGMRTEVSEISNKQSEMIGWRDEFGATMRAHLAEDRQEFNRVWDHLRPYHRREQS